MAVTLSNFNRIPVGNQWQVEADVTFSGSYVTGGSSEAITPESLGMQRVLSLGIGNKGGYMFEWDSSTGNVLVRWSAPLVAYQNPSPSGSAASVKTGVAPAYGSVKIEASNSPAADQTIQLGPMQEVPAGTPLSSITARVRAVGF